MAVLAWSALLAVAALGPALRPGVVLSYDMVAVPHPSFSWDQLGVGTELPRAVPLDAVVTGLTTVLPAGIVQKVALLGGLLAAGTGAGALTRSLPMPARLVAVTLAVWNPYVAERLVLGHWGLLLAYGALPWLVTAVRAGAEAPWWGLVLLLAVCALTPTGGVLALIVLTVGIVVASRAHCREDVRALGGAALAWLVLDVMWWLPGLLHGTAATTDAGSVAAFAARAELPGGVFPTLLGLGGVWNAEVVPDSRGTPLAVAALLVVLGLAGIGARAATRTDRQLAALLAVLAAAGVALALLGAAPGTDRLLAAAVSSVPGAGLLRDGQKFVALAVPFLAVFAAHGAQTVAGMVRDRTGAVTVVLAAALVPVALLPDLGWGAADRLEAVSYPPSWSAVRAEVARQRPDGDLLLLPWGAFRRYGWNDGRTVLDPARRAFPVSVLGDDRLAVGHRVLAAEDPRNRVVRRALGSGTLDARLLRRLGVRLVLVQRDQPMRVTPPAGTQPILTSGALQLLRVPGRVQSPPHTVGSAGRSLVVAADLVALGLVAAAGIGAGVAVVRSRRPRESADDRTRRVTRW